jgi:hypothetical protein
MSEHHAPRSAGSRVSGSGPEGSVRPAAASAPGPGKGGSAAGGERPVDVVVLGEKTEDQRGRTVLRVRADQLEVGELRPLESGRPITGEVVRLRPRAGSPRICDVDVEYSPPNRGSGRPPLVASDSYRANWDAIWSRRAPTGDGSAN